jgi:hypothetical protein
MVPGRANILVFEAFQSVNYPPPADLFADLTSLRFAQMSESPDGTVTDLPAGLFQLPYLFFTTYMGNGISLVRNGTFVSLTLRIINLSENPITYVETGAFSTTPALSHLFMGGCSLTRVPSAIFSVSSTLVYLLLSINQISELRSGDFVGMSMLTSLEVCTHAHSHAHAHAH